MRRSSCLSKDWINMGTQLFFLSLAALDDPRVTYFNQPFFHNRGNLIKDLVNDLFGVYNFDLDRERGGKLQDFCGVEHAIAAVALDAATHTRAGNLPFIKDIEQDFIDRFAVKFVGLIDIDREFFRGSAFDHNISLQTTEVTEKFLLLDNGS